jgi:hypothetical protein
MENPCKLLPEISGLYFFEPKLTCTWVANREPAYVCEFL